MEERRLGRLEVLGAWLGVWTPPRGAVVPPVPWRPIAAAASRPIASSAAPIAIGRQGTGGTTAPRGGVHTPNQAPSTSRRPSRRSSIALGPYL